MQYLLLFLSSFIAATFIPISSEGHLFLLFNNGYSGFLLVLFASSGNVLGGMLTYYLGVLCKWDWIEKYLRIKKEKIIKTQKRIKKYGALVAFFTWLPVIGDVLAICLGVLKVNWKWVLVLMSLGKTLRYLVLLLMFEN